MNKRQRKKQIKKMGYDKYVDAEYAKILTEFLIKLKEKQTQLPPGAFDNVNKRPWDFV